MNIVNMTGRLTKDPDVIQGGEKPVTRFSLALDRGKDGKGNDLGADYPNVVAFGKTAELVAKYLTKGRLIGVTGRIRTGSYEKDGKKIYTTDVVADRIEFLEKKAETRETPEQNLKRETDADIPAGFYQLNDEDIPF